jgi:hypothetical protein
LRIAPGARPSVSQGGIHQEGLILLRDVSAMTQFIGIRAALGGAVWIAPRRTARLFFIDLDANPQLAYFARLYAARELALAVGMMQSQGRGRRIWVRLALAVDAVDGLAALLAAHDGSLPKRAAAALVALPASAIAQGFKALSEEDEGPRIGVGSLEPARVA